MGCWGRAFWDCTRQMVHLGEEPKVGKGRYKVGLGRKKHVKIEKKGDKRGQSCKQAADQDTCLAMACTCSAQSLLPPDYTPFLTLLLFSARGV